MNREVTTCPTCSGTGKHQSCDGKGCRDCQNSGNCTTCNGWGTIGEHVPDDELDPDDTGWKTHREFLDTLDRIRMRRA